MKNNEKVVVVKQGSSVSIPLFLVFLVLKLVGVIHWSWWWVTCPLWIPWGFVALAFLFAVIVVVLAAIFK